MKTLLIMGGAVTLFSCSLLISKKLWLQQIPPLPSLCSFSLHWVRRPHSVGYASETGLFGPEPITMQLNVPLQASKFRIRLEIPGHTPQSAWQEVARSRLLPYPTALAEGRYYILTEDNTPPFGFQSQFSLKHQLEQRMYPPKNKPTSTPKRLRVLLEAFDQGGFQTCNFYQDILIQSFLPLRIEA